MLRWDIENLLFLHIQVGVEAATGGKKWNGGDWRNDYEKEMRDLTRTGTLGDDRLREQTEICSC
jgi:hypothetical protein